MIQHGVQDTEDENQGVSLDTLGQGTQEERAAPTRKVALEVRRECTQVWCRGGNSNT